MNIIVAGTGFSSILCINHLVKLGLKPIVLDVGNTINETKKIVLKKKSIVKQKNLNQFLCLGGLSNVWSGVIEKYNEQDFSLWPFARTEFDQYYDDVIKSISDSEILSFSAKSNDDILDYKITKNLKFSENKIFENENFSLKYASILSKINNINENSFDNLLPYSIDKNINHLITSSKINYKRAKITKVIENNKNEVVVEAFNSRDEKEIFTCNYLFLGCGAISTYLILKNSIKNFDNNIKIKSTKQFVLPVKFYAMQDFKYKFFNKAPIFQLNFFDKSSFSLYSQIYNLNPNIVNFLLRGIKDFNKYFFFLNFFKNIGFSYFNMGSDYVDQFIIDEKLNVKLFENKLNISKILSYYKFIFDKNLFKKQFYHYNIPYRMSPLGGNHYGSTFPMSDSKKSFFSSDVLGRVGDFKRISITDSSIFPKLSARPPTFTILANSIRIVKEVCKLNFFK